MEATAEPLRAEWMLWYTLAMSVPRIRRPATRRSLHSVFRFMGAGAISDVRNP